MLKRIPFLLILLGLCTGAHAQLNLQALTPPAEYDNIYVQPLHTDTLVSSFVIWIKKDVEPHLHPRHSEHIVVLEGMAEMLLGEELIMLAPGDVVFIPMGTLHAVKVIGDVPLKVMSLQAPKYHGGTEKKNVPLEYIPYTY